ncbi:integrase core domain-containing protein [Sulfitobacter sp. F26169L]|uniref:integrase core domain-containing protein n=1 Tax=Sulfitobacter sp. F26169L TaxID=2996015 RepID=UPI003A4C7D16
MAQPEAGSDLSRRDHDNFQARRVVKVWMAFYNSNRPHSALDWRTPDEAYWVSREEQKSSMKPKPDAL